ncbi:ATPase [Streptomyces sp. CS113]|uniref:N-acetylglucosamine kinase n=1 Tax=Streptomyces sp. CS113 TaxID=1982761 RepID=UPI000B41BEF5|nr:BadF/BadG/BcrA/BcrD ATPase family protein [Streptomyces sp. CS113]OVZ99973.1 ATPase [Streptomyces sp. CS113]
MTSVVAVDLGKTGCRAMLWDSSDSSRAVSSVAGAPGLAAPDGVAAARAAVRAAVGPLLREPGGARPDAVLVGAAGAASAPAAARSLVAALLEDLPVREAAVTSDAVTAHAGALGGRAGVVLAIGTGSVAVGIGADGTYARVDGWGPLLGDDGGGARIGTAGLRAALRAHDGRGPATALLDAAVGSFGDLERLPATVGRDGNPARTAASFAPEVARAADAGDAVASAIVREAAADLAETALAAAGRITAGGGDPLPTAVTGGLTGLGPALTAPLTAALTGSGLPLRLTPPLGDPLDGARLLALDRATPHASLVVRVRRTTANPSPTPATPPASA